MIDSFINAGESWYIIIVEKCRVRFGFVGVKASGN